MGRKRVHDETDGLNTTDGRAAGTNKRVDKQVPFSIVDSIHSTDPAVMAVEESGSQVLYRRTRKAEQTRMMMRNAILNNQEYIRCLARKDVQTAIRTAPLKLRPNGFFQKFENDPDLWRIKVLAEVGKIKLPDRLKWKSTEFRLLNLPKEVRVQVWREVVTSEFLIYPANPTGQEQPDLAMTCRELRKEVLPIFYESNVFAISMEEKWMNPMVEGRESLVRATRDRSRKAILNARWLEVMQSAGWIDRIRHFAFVLPVKGNASYRYISFRPRGCSVDECKIVVSVHVGFECLARETPACAAPMEPCDLRPAAWQRLQSMPCDKQTTEIIRELSTFLHGLPCSDMTSCRYWRDDGVLP